jgi:cellulose synthase/poly-beta-1,6-N-acetylglucosamine synthase-like glycosyltransferase
MSLYWQSLLSNLLTAAAAFLLIPAIVLLVEVAASIAWPRREDSPKRRNGLHPRVAVLVPAHDESLGLLPTISDIKAQLRVGDRLVVVADNCSDDTSSVAAAAGAEVVERSDGSRIGKGYALDFGLRHLSADPPEIVIVIDADCRLSENAITQLAVTCCQTGRPVQALDLMTAPKQSSLNYQVAEFAWRVKNWVRPLGLRNLNLSCQLMGTGMAFPWRIISAVDLASGRIVEDLKLGLDLALSGHPAVFSPSAIVTSHFPESIEGAVSQRQRWEHGHIHTIVSVVPRLLFLAMIRRNLNLLALTLDLAIPPLSLFGLLATGIFALSGVAALLGFSSIALIVSASGLMAFELAILMCWWKYGRDLLPLNSMLLIAPYVFGKIYIYCRLLLRGGASQWIRTDRKKPKQTIQSDPHDN